MTSPSATASLTPKLENRIAGGTRARLWALAPAFAFAILTALWTRRVGVALENCRIALDAAAALRGRFLPLAFNYKGGPGVYILLAPFVLAFGATLRAIRASAVFWSAACVAATGLLAERAAGSRRAGVLAACLAAVTPGLSEFTPWGQFGGCAETALAAAALAEMIACARDRREGSARRAGLLLGLALTTKTVVAAVVVGLLVWALLNRARFGPPERRLVRQGALFFAAPLVPYLWALAGGGLWRLWLSGPVLPLDYIPGVWLRLRQALVLLARSPSAPPPVPMSTAAAACAALLAAAALLRFARTGQGARRRAAFLWTLCACFLALSPFSPSRLRMLHLLTVLPVFWAAVAASLALEAPAGARRAGALLAAAYLATAGAATAYSAFRLAQDGGAGTPYDLTAVAMSRYFAANPRLSPASLVDGSEGDMIQLLSGRAPRELDPEGASSADEEGWKGALDDPRNVFLVSASQSDEPVRRRAARRGYRLVETAVFVDGLGAPVYRALSVRR